MEQPIYFIIYLLIRGVSKEREDKEKLEYLTKELRELNETLEQKVELIEKFEKSPQVYHLVKTSGRYNLILSVAASNLESIEDFIASEIRSKPGVKHIEVNIGELPIVPKGWNMPIG